MAGPVIVGGNARIGHAAYEREYAAAFGFSPVEGAHIAAHYRDGYLALLSILAERYEVPAPVAPLPTPDLTPEASFEARYVEAGWVLAHLPEPSVKEAPCID
jgi:hypothetical protein